MKKGIKILTLLNCVGCIFCAAWAYTSHMENMINVGGLRGDYDYWLKLEPFLNVPALIIWLALLTGTPINASRSRLNWKRSILLVALNLVIMPAIFIGLAMFLDRGLNCPA